MSVAINQALTSEVDKMPAWPVIVTDASDDPGKLPKFIVVTPVVTVLPPPRHFRGCSFGVDPLVDLQIANGVGPRRHYPTNGLRSRNRNRAPLAPCSIKPVDVVIVPVPKKMSEFEWFTISTPRLPARAGTTVADVVVTDTWAVA